MCGSQVSGHRSQSTTLRPVTNDLRSALTLRELEPLAGLRTTRLLALDGAGVTRQQPERAELGAVAFVDLHERAGDRETEGTGLAGVAAAIDIRLDVITPEGIGRHERLLDGRHV